MLSQIHFIFLIIYCRDVTRHLQILLRREGYIFKTSAEFEVVRAMKEVCVCVCVCLSVCLCVCVSVYNVILVTLMSIALLLQSFSTEYL